MALVACPECGREVSTKAATCPGCGSPIAETVQPFGALTHDTSSNENPAKQNSVLGQMDVVRGTGAVMILGCFGLFLLAAILGLMSRHC